MPNLNESELIDAAMRLDDLGRRIAKACIEWDAQLMADLVAKFIDTKNSIAATAIANPILKLSGINNTKARALVRAVAAGEALPIENALLARLVDCDLDEIQLAEIGREELYSWMSHVEYAEGLYQVGALVVGCRGLPDNLSTFVREARQCFAFQQYNAVCALCRTMLELSVKDIATAFSILPADRENIVHLAVRGQVPLSRLIGEITAIPAFRHLQDELHQVRILTNAIVHGNRSVDATEAAAILKRTLDSIHSLYEVQALAE